MTKVHLLLTATVALLLTAIVLAITFARGYTFDIKKKELTATGILVATSDPDGAEVFINGKLKTATNNTLNLAPGKYQVKIQKDGYTPWAKEVTIKREEVFKTNVFLFPNLPDLRPLTVSGASHLVFSPDGTKIVYTVASASAERTGVWVADLARTLLPPIISRADLKQIYHDNALLSLSQANFLWSPDGKQALAYFGTPPSVATPSAAATFLLDIENTNPSPTVPNTTLLLSQWAQIDNTKLKSQISKLDPKIAGLLATNAANLRFSPDESKVLYQATASATLPQYLSTPLPGSNPTREIRNLTPGNTYVYDLKEDKNYLIQNCNPPAGGANCRWFPTSRHLLIFSDKEISVVEYDGTNAALIYAGPFINGYVFPWPDARKIVILTSLNNPQGSDNNLYTINLR